MTDSSVTLDQLVRRRTLPQHRAAIFADEAEFVSVADAVLTLQAAIVRLLDVQINSREADRRRRGRPRTSPPEVK
jgi:hypothetical protein